MKELAAGSLVRHRTLGRGKVVAVEPAALHVFFPDSDTRYAAKLRWPAAGAFLSQDGLEPDPWLSGLTSFAKDSASGRWALDANFMSQDEAVALFLSENPGGFQAPAPGKRGAPRVGRGARWRAASEAWASSMGEGRSARLLEDGEYEELGARALRVALLAGEIPGMPEPDVLEEAFAPGDATGDFLDALLGYLSVPSPARARFERLCAATHALGAPSDAAWALVTFFPFVAVPTRQVVLLPRSACPGASRLGCELQYQAVPNWVTYTRYRDLSSRLLEKLAPHGARDHVDVECFVHTTGTRRASRPAKGAGTPARREGSTAAPARGAGARSRRKG